MPAYRDKDCPECGRLAPMTALRCDCGYKFPPPPTWTKQERVESRIYDQAELVLVLADLDDAARPIGAWTPREIPKPRSPIADVQQASTEEASSTIERFVRGTVFNGMLAACAVWGFIFAPRATLVVAIVIGMIVFVRRKRK